MTDLHRLDSIGRERDTSSNLPKVMGCFLYLHFYAAMEESQTESQAAYATTDDGKLNVLFVRHVIAVGLFN